MESAQHVVRMHAALRALGWAALLSQFVHGRSIVVSLLVIPLVVSLVKVALLEESVTRAYLLGAAAFVGCSGVAHATVALTDNPVAGGLGLAFYAAAMPLAALGLRDIATRVGVRRRWTRVVVELFVAAAALLLLAGWSMSQLLDPTSSSIVSLPGETWRALLWFAVPVVAMLELWWAFCDLRARVGAAEKALHSRVFPPPELAPTVTRER